MQRLEVSGAVRPIYGSLGVKRLRKIKTRRIYNIYLVLFRLLGLNNRNLFWSDLTDSIITSFTIFNCNFSSSFSSTPPS